MLSYHIECLEFSWGKKNTRLCVRLIAQEMQWSICSIRESTANASQTSDSRQTRILLNIRAVQKRKASTAEKCFQVGAVVEYGHGLFVLF